MNTGENDVTRALAYLASDGDAEAEAYARPTAMADTNKIEHEKLLAHARRLNEEAKTWTDRQLRSTYACMNSTNQTEPGRPYFLWLDLETTGLNPKDDVVLEVGAVLTDRQLRPLSVFNKVCLHLRSAILDKMDDYVLKMHLDSGLLSEVWKAEQTPLQVLVDLSDWVRSELMLADSTGSKLYLAGSSIGFDWGFLDQGLPPSIGLRSILHYRKVDVSVYKVCFPTLLKQPEGGPAHRVLEDINYSIDQQRQMDQLLADAPRP